MKVTNNSDIKISDEEINEIVKADVRINLWNRVKEIIVEKDTRVILVEDIGEPNFLWVGKLNKSMRWGLDGN